MARDQIQGQGQNQGVRPQGQAGELTREQADAQMGEMANADLKAAMFFIECLADDAKHGRTQANRKSRGKDKLGPNGRLDIAKSSEKTADKAGGATSGVESQSTQGSAAMTASATSGTTGGGNGGPTAASAGGAIAMADKSLNNWFDPNDKDPAKGLSAVI